MLQFEIDCCEMKIIKHECMRMETLSLVGIVLGLVLLIYLAYHGLSIIWVAPVCAALVAVLG